MTFTFHFFLGLALILIAAGLCYMFRHENKE